MTIAVWPNRVQVLGLSDFVDRHPTVLQGRHIKRRPACVVATQQAVHVVLSEIRLIGHDEVAADGGFPSLQVRQQAVLHELCALHLDVAVRATGQVLDHVRGHAEGPADLDDLILPRLQKLCRLVAAAEFVCLYAVGQHSRAEGTISAPVHPLPLLTQPLGSLYGDRVF